LAPILGLLNGRIGIKFDIKIRFISNNSIWLSPLDNNNKVLIKGIANASKGVIPIGGQHPPISSAGDKLECA
jgi:hypothetical protein